MKRIIVFLFIVLSSSIVFSQQQLNFSFAENPNTLLLNPGAETNYKYHFGIPFLSGFNLSMGSTNITLEDLFVDDGTPFQTLFQRTLTKLENTDYVNIDAKIDVLFGGIRLNDRDYISFGFYQDIQAISYIPKDLTELVYYGNANGLNRTYKFSELVTKGEIVGVWHVGISRKVNRKLNLGARLKIYSGSFNAETNHNSGTFTTYQNDTNLLRQNLNDIDVAVRTSGLINNEGNVSFDTGTIFSNSFFSGNLGLGLDFGMTYHFTPQFEFTASILDFGFIRYKKNNRTYKAKGDYSFDGINYEYDPDDPTRDYWQEFLDDFDANVPTEENEGAYTSWRPSRFNAAIKYSFGQIRSKVCYSDTHKKYYFNAIGFQISNVMRPLKPQFAFTSFFETSFSEHFHTKITHTINDYSATIIGSGISVDLGKVNVFGFVDNMLAAMDFETANNISFNFGVNIIVD